MTIHHVFTQSHLWGKYFLKINYHFSHVRNFIIFLNSHIFLAEDFKDNFPTITMLQSYWSNNESGAMTSDHDLILSSNKKEGNESQCGYSQKNLFPNIYGKYIFQIVDQRIFPL